MLDISLGTSWSAYQLVYVSRYNLRTINKLGDIPGGPVVKTSPSNAGSVGLICGQGSKIPHTFWTNQNKAKHKNRRSIVTNSIKVLKRMAHIKKSFKKKRQKINRKK